MKAQWAKVILVVMLPLLIGGCTRSLSQIRQYEPYRTFTSNKPPREVAKCIELKIREQKGVRWYKEKSLNVSLEEHPDQSYRIAITVPPSAIADILVKPSRNGVVVEYRKHPAVGWNFAEERWFDYIEECAR